MLFLFNKVIVSIINIDILKFLKLNILVARLFAYTVEVEYLTNNFLNCILVRYECDVFYRAKIFPVDR